MYITDCGATRDIITAGAITRLGEHDGMYVLDFIIDDDAAAVRVIEVKIDRW